MNTKVFASFVTIVFIVAFLRSHLTPLSEQLAQLMLDSPNADAALGSKACQTPILNEVNMYRTNQRLLEEFIAVFKMSGQNDKANTAQIHCTV